MRGKPLLWLAALAVSLMLTSCTPGDIGTVGIRREADGSLTALIRLCRGSVDTLLLRPVNSVPPGAGGGPRSDGWESASSPEYPLDVVVTGDADVLLAFAEDELRVDVLYRIYASGRDGRAGSGFFAAAELALIEPGQILAPSRADADGLFQIQSPAGFEAAADRYC